MDDLINILHGGNHSLVVANGAFVPLISAELQTCMICCAMIQAF